MNNKPCRARDPLQCPAIHGNRNGYCDAHQHLVKQQTNQRYKDNAARTKSRYGFNPYQTRAWARARAVIIALQKGLCQVCLSEGIYKSFDHVDHITPVAQLEPTLEAFCDLDNLQCICKECHAKKTGSERKR